MAGIGVESRCRRVFAYQSLMPAGTGTPRCEKPESWVGSANLHGGFCHAPTRPQRGTSPRTTLALGRLLPISRLTFCRAGFVRGFPPPRERQLRGSVGFEVTVKGAKRHFRTNDEWQVGLTSA